MQYSSASNNYHDDDEIMTILQILQVPRPAHARASLYSYDIFRQYILHSPTLFNFQHQTPGSHQLTIENVYRLSHMPPHMAMTIFQ